MVQLHTEIFRKHVTLANGLGDGLVLSGNKSLPEPDPDVCHHMTSHGHDILKAMHEYL